MHLTIIYYIIISERVNITVGPTPQERYLQLEAQANPRARSSCILISHNHKYLYYESMENIHNKKTQLIALKHKSRNIREEMMRYRGGFGMVFAPPIFFSFFILYIHIVNASVCPTNFS